MATNLAIDDVLLERARRVGKLRTKKETVTQALTEFIQRRRQRKILKALGTIEFRKGWDYKKDRRDRESGRLHLRVVFGPSSAASR
jgi:Arc/MetJ family transcription regulator